MDNNETYRRGQSSYHLLYTDEQQNFEYALLVFEKVNKIFMEIDE